MSRRISKERVKEKQIWLQNTPVHFLLGVCVHAVSMSALADLLFFFFFLRPPFGNKTIRWAWQEAAAALECLVLINSRCFHSCAIYSRNKSTKCLNKFLLGQQTSMFKGPIWSHSQAERSCLVNRFFGIGKKGADLQQGWTTVFPLLTGGSRFAPLSSELGYGTKINAPPSCSNIARSSVATSCWREKRMTKTLINLSH